MKTADHHRIAADCHHRLQAPSGKSRSRAVILVAVAVALKPLEQWYLWKLQSEDEAIRVAATGKLGKMKFSRFPQNSNVTGNM